MNSPVPASTARRCLLGLLCLAAALAVLVCHHVSVQCSWVGALPLACRGTCTRWILLARPLVRCAAPPLPASQARMGPDQAGSAHGALPSGSLQPEAARFAVGAGPRRQLNEASSRAHFQAQLRARASHPVSATGAHAASEEGSQGDTAQAGAGSDAEPPVQEPREFGIEIASEREGTLPQPYAPATVVRAQVAASARTPTQDS